jgi:hypothetical protein
MDDDTFTYAEHALSKLGDRARLLLEIVACPTVPRNVTKQAWRLWTAYARLEPTPEDMDALLASMDAFLTQANVRPHAMASHVFSHHLNKRVYALNTSM